MYTQVMPEEHIERDLPCARCGYNLRGVVVDERCPECGSPIQYSLHGDWLRYADRHWAGQVLRGLQWTMVSRRAIAILYVTFIVSVLVIAVVLLGPFAVPPTVETMTKSGFDTAARIVGGIVCLLSIGIAYGLWCASASEPREGAATPVSTAVTRAVSILLVPAFGLWILALSSWTPLGFSAVARYAVATACFVIVWLHFHVVLHQVQTLERRCGGISAARMGRIASFRDAALYLPAILLAFHWIGPLRWEKTGGWTPPDESIAFMLMGLGWLIITGLLKTTITLMRAELAAGAHLRG
jgi:hypothetical protein